MKAMSAYYNENDPFMAAWLRQLVKDGLIAPGEVDDRDIQQVASAFGVAQPAVSAKS
jgi:DNA (cytosine-5)-methyltransferase 1